MFRSGVHEFSSDDWRADDFRSVDDLLDTRHTKSDVHGGDTGKVESLQGHLRTGLTNRLGADSANSRSGLDLRSQVPHSADLEESMDLIRRDFVGIVQNLSDGD